MESKNTLEIFPGDTQAGLEAALGGDQGDLREDRPLWPGSYQDRGGQQDQLRL